MNIRDLFFTTVYEKVKAGEDIVIVTPDLAAPSLDQFRADFPDHYISVGIAEQNLIETASGLAATGQKTIAWGLNPFVVTRAFDQLKNTVSLMNLPVLFAGLHAGLSSAISGATHVVISDLTLVRTLANVKAYNISDLSLGNDIFEEAFRFRHPCYFRFDKDIHYQLSRTSKGIDLGFSVVKEGDRGGKLILSTGRHVGLLLNVLEKLSEKGIRPTLIDLFRFPCDQVALANQLRKYEQIVTVEEHILQGGLGSYVLEIMADQGILRPVCRFGIDNENGYPQVEGGRDYFNKLFHLDEQGLFENLVEHFGQKSHGVVQSKTKEFLDKKKTNINRIITEDFEKLLSAYGDKFEKMRNCTVLITGATGMISTYLSEFLIYISDKYNIQLYLQCRNTDKAKRVFKGDLSKENVHLVHFDFENNDIPDIRFDYILHAASPASTSAFEKIPVDVISPNTIGTWNLLQHARKKGTSKFLIFSSGSVYGQSEKERTSIAEEDYGVIDPLQYRSCYAESKRLSEQMGMAFWKQYNVPSSFVRICHTYGPTFDLEKDLRLIPRVVKQILNREDITVYKDSSSVVQYTYIADMISAILLVLLEGQPGEAYNAGGDDVVKIDDVIGWMVHADQNIESKLIEKEIDANYKFGKNSGTSSRKLCNHKLKELGWRQLYTPKDGFTRMIKCYMEDNKNLGGGGRSIVE